MRSHCADLRRIDWRFLIPSENTGDPPGSLVLLGGDPALAELLLETGAAQTLH